MKLTFALAALTILLCAEITSDEPFPTAYYPGVFEKEKATTLTFSSGDRLQDFDIHIPSQKSLRTIEGKLLFSDGRPAGGDSVKFVPEGMNDNMDAQSLWKRTARGVFDCAYSKG